MKRLILGFAALSVLSAASAMAQDDNGRRDAGADQRKPAAAEQSRDNRQATADQRRQTERNMHAQNGAAMQDHRAAVADQRRQMGRDIHAQNGAAMQARRSNFAQYRRAVVATRHFRAGVYAAPPGYAYRRWGVGQALPPMYFARNYWVTNWVAYGLFAPPPGLAWVRFGPDILLIDIATGDVVQAQYGFFI